MPRLTTITLYEHDEKRYRDIAGDKKAIQDALIKLNKQFKKDFKKLDRSEDNSDTEDTIDESKGVVEVYANKIKARHYVGFAAVDNVFLQILPKVFKPKKEQTQETQEDTWEPILAFIRMLDMAYGLKIKDHDLAYLQGRNLRPNLYEVFIYLFAKSLWSEVQRGYHREYVEVHREEKFLRGKLLMSRQIRKLPHQLNTFSVEVHELIEDNLLNRIFYASVREALRRTTWGLNRKLLGELMLAFDGITPIHLRTEHFERVHFTRLNERFRRPFELAKLLFMPASGKGRSREVSGFFVDMNKLFERFIERVLVRNLPPEYKLFYQESYPFLKNQNGSSQKPDYVVRKGNTPVVVLDAKYRELKERIPSSDMLRQLYVYSRIWGYKTSHENDSKPPAVIVIPSSSTYNQGLPDKPLEFEFFDERKLFIVAYNMDYVKTGAIFKADKNFRRSLNNIIGKLNT
ncbi:McrC family protein [Thermococcus gammatolerans]|uniref:McrBC 5-methylcytosine restriction system component n=1 Tax=Thermococcus gammatolerans (strain DSM 15229 / JCM 11827 / EJ3) TaxID=593117 RepID=C5A3Z2_THEGJ|nr:McrBC 5-methylcytosine restriction system component [Thermococcus gammatolerans]6UT5_G Chain G, McrBC 5-methylcytosine restriction system component [Thermococcus gammatolerans]6UT7_G Chain G, McrBC 5-methylcytosine restriction system component [Thermococcus gammatolerans]6UT7_N Chain N, McrBC 5-methylcytosine restriction system component [Thermococcus gammatolerans]6UT8_G Chain G, McrBC 5-methylcytosine restriction system component [Thermococcus gammatolerans]ACS32954.1 McrBC 5-methylcytosi